MRCAVVPRGSCSNRRAGQSRVNDGLVFEPEIITMLASEINGAAAAAAPEQLVPITPQPLVSHDRLGSRLATIS
ncbi:MAG: hypothetical protein Ct9H300mP31_17200 [Acidimicrobiaceae bacterium]|nr:MAG: hypothetical protein Ct9H300mP31_17200 [Acidimicrobiaceae bacterium]